MWEDDAGSIDINGTLFFLQQAHWHWPAEHTINCRRLISPKLYVGIDASSSDFKAIIQFHLFHFPPKQSNINLSQTKNSPFVINKNKICGVFLFFEIKYVEL
ncbi:Alpha carbonic anhydrase 7 [Glycine max]|nr:Alpha carbonic anhydrase 7 [Glycine max]